MYWQEKGGIFLWHCNRGGLFSQDKYDRDPTEVTNNLSTSNFLNSTYLKKNYKFKKT